MENTSVFKRAGSNEELAKIDFDKTLPAHERSRNNPVLENILSEGGDDFFQYLNWIGLGKEPNLMVLSSLNHYYYDHHDLMEIRTLINLKKLNQIKHLESFLHTLYRILPSKAYFVSCFKNDNHHEHRMTFYQSSKFLNGLISIFESRDERILSKRGVTRLLEDYGFKVIDITDINGMTYFWAQNLRRPGE
jgi:hypothetical protein